MAASPKSSHGWSLFPPLKHGEKSSSLSSVCRLAFGTGNPAYSSQLIGCFWNKTTPYSDEQITLGEWRNQAVSAQWREVDLAMWQV